MINSLLSFSFKLDELAIIMVALIAYISICVASFAYRYMDGDAKYKIFFVYLTLLAVSITVTVSTDNIILLLFSYCFSNMLLVRLMIHKPNWKAAKASGILALKNYLLSALFMGSGSIILYMITKQFNISSILSQNANSVPMVIALVLLLIAAMMQSAIWPFHKWLISSLNSPTPVSAIMHAGLINGGGVLLVRFAPLYLHHATLLIAIFCIGVLTALLGTLWKLMQNDVKRMLACSTMGQMGFMFVQCGLGLFPAAVAHLVSHGMFKAYLFLASGSAAQEKRLDLGYPPSFSVFISALVCGFCGGTVFAYVTHESWLAGNTTIVLLFIAFITLSQFAIPILQCKAFRRLPLALILIIILGLSYGSIVRLIVWAMEPMGVMQPQPLNILHIIGIIVLGLTWLSTLFLKDLVKNTEIPSWLLKAYVSALNASQPNPATITAHRNHYQY